MSALGWTACRGRSAAAPFAVLFVALLLLGSVAASPAAPAATARGDQSAPDEVAAARRTRLAEFLAAIAGLRNAELGARLDELWERDPGTTMDAVLLRAGREIPPFVTAARRAQREATRAEAAAWIETRMARGEDQRRSWNQRLADLLGDPDGGGPLWTAAASVVAERRLVELSDLLADGLACGRPEVRAAARRALFALFLRWFEGRDEFAAFWEAAGRRGPEGPYLEQLRGLEARWRALATGELQLDPARAFTAIDAADPRLRAAAAAALARGVAGGPIDPASATEKLFERLRREEDPAAFVAVLDALVATQAQAPVDAPALRELRQILVVTINGGHPGLQAPVAHALERLPWDVASSAGTNSVMRAIEWVVQELRDPVLSDELVDGDVLVAALRALTGLSERALAAGLDLSGASAPVRELVLARVEDPAEPELVRVAAASLAARLAGPGDIARLTSVLERGAVSTNLSYTLIGALGEMVLDVDPAGVEAQRVLATLVVELRAADPDLRGRALSILSDERLGALIGQADPARFVAALGDETVQAHQSQLLALIARHERPDLVEPILSGASFDAMAHGDAGRVAELATTLRALAAGDGALVFKSAERLVAIAGEATRMRRLREALGLVAALVHDQALRLTTAQHAAIVAWALELRSAGASRLEIEGAAASFLRRLVDVHVSQSVPPGGNGKGALSYTTALFSADLLAVDPSAMDPALVEGHFAAALAHAVAQPAATPGAPSGEPTEVLVLRDWARHRLARDDRPGALEKVRELFAARARAAAAAAARGAEPPAALLELTDLRAAGELLAVPVSTAREAARAAAREACAVSLELVGRPAWRRETVGVRHKDLAALAERARRSQEPAAVQSALALFAGLPPLPPEGGPPPPNGEGHPDAPWSGLLAERARHAELLAMADGLRALELELAGPAPAPVEAGAPGGAGDGGDTAGQEDEKEKEKGGEEASGAGGGEETGDGAGGGGEQDPAREAGSGGGGDDRAVSSPGA